MIRQWMSIPACLFASVIAALVFTAPALATQYLITPGDDWQRFNGKLKPGDEVILMPGKHKTAIFDDLSGTEKQPVTIRGLGGKAPSIIANQRDGLRFNRPRHVVIKDLTITDCGLGGISITPGVILTGSPQPASSDAEPLGPITISGVRLINIGLRNNRDALLLNGVDNVQIDHCEFAGWNSCGIELIGCHDVVIDECIFKSAEGFSPAHGIQLRAGSERVEIRNSRFECGAKRVVSVGGASKVEHFRPLLETAAKPATCAEAAHVTIENCYIIGGQLPLAFVNADNGTVRNCTIVRPKGFVFAVLSEQADPRIMPGRNFTFGSNIIVWETGDLQKLVNIAKNIPDNAIQLQSNLWWSTQSTAERDKLGPMPGASNWPQTTDVDPKLNEQLRPAEDRAAEFGVQVTADGKK